ncbi:MAG: amidohydrolase family protein [Candidatus Helarchaeota archaeon]
MDPQVIKQKLTDLGINPKNVVNAHVHLPEINASMIENAQGQMDHAMLPKEILIESIQLLTPRHFYTRNRHYSGAAIILPLEAHNVQGTSSMLYCSNRRVLRLAKRYPEFYIPFASIDMTAKETHEKIPLLRDSGFVGIKYHALEGYSLCDPRCVESLKQLEALNMPLVVHLGDTPFEGVNLEYADPQILLYLVKEFPTLRIMATHFATPLHHTLFWIASRYETIFLDTAEFPIYWRASSENPYGGLLHPLNTRRIGLHKFIFGTDFPMPTFQYSTHGTLKIGIHDPGEYLYEFLTLPETYFTTEEKYQILCENVWTFLGKQRTEIISSNRKIKMKA